MSEIAADAENWRSQLQKQCNSKRFSNLKYALSCSISDDNRSRDA